MKILSLLKKNGLSYAIYKISFSSPKGWSLICNFWNFLSFSKNVDYHMKFLKFLSHLQNRGLSYAILRISSTSPKMWSIICNFWNFFPFSKNVDYHMQFMKFFLFAKKVVSHVQ